MFEDGIPTVERDEEQRMKSLDIAELLEQAVFGQRNGSQDGPAAAEAVAEAAAVPAD
jgi:hypothetical protein